MKIGLRVTVYQGMIVLLSVLVLTVIVGQGQGETITVDDNGDADHSSIQEAVDEAQDGDAILIYSGDYSENIQVKKRVTITGEDRDTTRITGKDNAYVLEILYDGVKVIRDAHAILICGPGEAKIELKKAIEKSKEIQKRVVEIETVDKMTQRQIAAKVREYFTQ